MNIEDYGLWVRGLSLIKESLEQPFADWSSLPEEEGIWHSFLIRFNGKHFIECKVYPSYYEIDFAYERGSGTPFYKTKHSLRTALRAYIKTLPQQYHHRFEHLG